MPKFSEALRRIFPFVAVGGFAAGGAQEAQASGVDQEAQKLANQDKQAETITQAQVQTLEQQLNSIGATLAPESVLKETNSYQGTRDMLTQPGPMPEPALSLGEEKPALETAVAGGEQSTNLEGVEQGVVVAVETPDRNVCEQLGIPFGQWETAVSFQIPADVNIRQGSGMNFPFTTIPRETFAAGGGVIATPDVGGWLHIWGNRSGDSLDAAVAGWVLGIDSASMDKPCAILTDRSTVDTPIPEGFVLQGTQNQPTEPSQQDEPIVTPPLETAAPGTIPAPPTGEAGGTPPAAGTEAAGEAATQPAIEVHDGAPTPMLLENVPMINGVPTLLSPVPTPNYFLSPAMRDSFVNIQNTRRAILETWNLSNLDLDQADALVLGGKEVPIGIIDNPREYRIPVISSDGLLTVTGYYRGITRIDGSNTGFVYAVDTLVNGQVVRLVLGANSQENMRSNLGITVPNSNVQLVSNATILEAIRNTAVDSPIIIQVWNSERTGDPNYDRFLYDQREATRAVLSGEIAEDAPFGLIVADALYLPVPNN